MRQQYLFTTRTMLDLHPLSHYEALFRVIDFSPMETLVKKKGRIPFSPESLLKVIIYKNLKGLASLSEISRDLADNPSLCLSCGFDPLSSPPTVERFSSFLRTTPNDIFQQIRIALVKSLIRKKEISGKYLSIDGSNVPVSVKENNPKVNTSNRFDKTLPPKGDKQARLGVKIVYSFSKERKVSWFWGYKNFCISDSKGELPIWEVTRPANVSEPSLFVSLFRQVRQEFPFTIKGVLGDAIYDIGEIYDFIIHVLGAKPYIAHNPRAGREVKLSRKGNRVCLAGFEMVYWGKFQDRGKVRLKFVCPITHSKKFREKQPYCPWFHPRFLKGNGCVAYRRVPAHQRDGLRYRPGEFVKIYRLRTGTERIFSRLLTITMQNPSVRGLQAVSNHCTIAHITILAVALAAVESGQRDKIRFIKTFLPGLYTKLSRNS